MRLVGSLAIHALLAVLLVSTHHARRDGGDVPRIELVDIAPPLPPPPPAPVSPPPVSGSRAARRSVYRSSAPHAAPSTAINGELRIEPMSGGRGDGDREGQGNGLGLGNGRGLADLVPEVPRAPVPPPAPPAPRVSKARPARLIYPSRQTEVEEASLFVADVIVDDEGFVVGARLARGTGGPRDAEAGAAVWRFRYDPARDDDGVRIRSTVQQRFAIAW